MKQNYGLQLYSIRDITDKDLGASLERVAALGYSFVEFPSSEWNFTVSIILVGRRSFNGECVPETASPVF